MHVGGEINTSTLTHLSLHHTPFDQTQGKCAPTQILCLVVPRGTVFLQQATEFLA